MKPTITISNRRVYETKKGEHSPRVRTEYRIEGGTLAPGWQTFLRSGRVAYCHFAVWDGSDQLGSYGGEVWPSAWPELFEALPPSAQGGSGGYRITAAGRAALEAAK